MNLKFTHEKIWSRPDTWSVLTPGPAPAPGPALTPGPTLTLGPALTPGPAGTDWELNIQEHLYIIVLNLTHSAFKATLCRHFV